MSYPSNMKQYIGAIVMCVRYLVCVCRCIFVKKVETAWNQKNWHDREFLYATIIFEMSWANA
jgi:hypothetical protein